MQTRSRNVLDPANTFLFKRDLISALYNLFAPKHISLESPRVLNRSGQVVIGLLHDLYNRLPDVFKATHVKLCSQPVTQRPIPDMLEVDHVKLCSQPVTQRPILDVLEAAHVKLSLQPVTHNPIPDRLEVHHIKLYPEHVLLQRQDVVLGRGRYRPR